MELSPRSGGQVLPSRAPHTQHAAPRVVGQREVPIRLQQVMWQTAAVEPREQNGCRRFKHRQRRRAEKVREAHVRGILAEPDRVHQVRVGIKLDRKVRRTALAAEPGVHAVENPRASGEGSGRCGAPLHCFLRTGGGAISFAVFSASFRASRVPSIASSSVTW